MSKAKPLLFGAALGASAMFFAQQYHVVHSHDGLQVVPRTPQQSLGLAYADIRNWSPSQWTDRPELARALMAHGSTDLISESVAATLADRVSEDTSTLDELRGFLNGSKKAPAGSDSDNSDAPASDLDSHDSNRSGSGSGEGADNDLFRIPFPQDARTKAPADPFREARAEEKTAPTQPNAGSRTANSVGSTPPQKSRFSSDEVLDGLNAADFQEETRTPLSSSAGPAAAKSAASGKSVKEQANEMADRIFGKSAPSSAPTSTTSKPTTTAPPIKASPKPTESESMFEEVTTQLENRAQDALNRARDTAKDKALATAEESSKSSANYVRDRAAEMLPEAAKAILNGNAAKPATPAPSAVLDFDPFLE